MINFYRILFIPVLLIAAPYYGMRMLRRGGYAKDFQHRWGAHKKLPPKAEGKQRVWIQAVSVGEVEAIASLVERFCEDGKTELVLTTTTSTGYEILRKKYADKVLYTGIFPIDFYPFSRRAWNNFRPDMAVLMEGELWPEHLHQAQTRNVPVVLVNARMSDKSFRRYMKFPMFAERILSKLSLIAASNILDMNRFLKLGADRNKIFCSGNLKFDTPVQTVLDDDAKLALRAELGFTKDSLVLLGSSTWANEEKMLAETLLKIRTAGIDCRLLLVPRHAERRAEAEAAIADLPHCVRSKNRRAPSETIAYLADTTGELRIFTQIADLAFVGKSLAPNEGGQSPLDCAAFAVAMVYGNKMSNFKGICSSLESHCAAVKVSTYGQAQAELLRLAKSRQLREEIGGAAKCWHTSNIGATRRCYDALKKLLKY